MKNLKVLLKRVGTGSLAPLLLLSVSCSKVNHNIEGENHHVFISFAPNGWVNPAALPPSKTFTSPADRLECEEALKKAVCDTNLSSSEIEDDWETASCAADSKKFVPALMAFYDEMPERLRPSLCSIYKIFISDQIPSTAFASPILNDANDPPIGAYIGARKSTFLQQPSVHSLVSWKEQLPFGGSSDFLANDPHLLQIDYGLKTQLPADGLFYVLVHELVHLSDFNNHAVQTLNCGRNVLYPGCVPTPGTFAALSWKSLQVPLTSSAYLKQDQFCYYQCSGQTISGSEAFDIYSSMLKSSFITPYSGVNMREDFAEFFVWNLMSRYKGINYRVQFPGQGELDMNQGLSQNPSIRAKLDFMDRLWNSPGLKILNQ